MTNALDSAKPNKLRRRVNYTIALLLFVFGCSCEGPLAWTTTYVSEPSPDGQYRIRIQGRGCLADCTARIVVESRIGLTHEIARRTDCWFGFTEVYWHSDSYHRLALFFDGRVCGQMRLAYEIHSGARSTPIPFETLEPFLRKAIEHNCDLTAAELQQFEGDVFRWASDQFEGYKTQDPSRCRQGARNFAIRGVIMDFRRIFSLISSSQRPFQPNNRSDAGDPYVIPPGVPGYFSHSAIRSQPATGAGQAAIRPHDKPYHEPATGSHPATRSALCFRLPLDVVVQ